MPTYFQRPENALKRANEFIDVGKPQRALDALYDVIKSKRHRTWQKIHEPIIEKYLELCVELKKSHTAKEGLYQYKIICQQVNTKSLEDIVKKYLSLAEEKTDLAKTESHQSVVDVDDLDILQTPEMLLMSAVSGEDNQDRADRAILTPWLKFLWESYRQCLDLLRNNSTLEKLYQEVAQNAFKFCLKYSRKTEFRKLCEILRTHLGHTQKSQNQNQQRAINLNNPESQSMHLETRLVQLDSAIQIELWQEAYKAVEDIQYLIVLSKKQPRPSLLANYYQKIGLVLQKSGNSLFHAAAWHRLYHLYREQRKNMTEHEQQKLVSRVVCATLSIPLPLSRNQGEHILEVDDNGSEKHKKLSGLLSLSVVPTRASLVRDLAKYNLTQHMFPELIGLYEALEVDFNPLELSANVAPKFDFISKKEDLMQYLPALQDITLIHFIKQISQIYSTIEFDRLSDLAPFNDPFRLERLILEAAKNLELQVRVDHKTHSLRFGTDLAASKNSDDSGGMRVLQSMPSKQVHSQLMLMARALAKAVHVISPNLLHNSLDGLRQQMCQMYKQGAKKEHMLMLKRKDLIESRKEELEILNQQREQEEMDLLNEQQRRQEEAERARLQREAEERERKRRATEHHDIQKKVVKEKLEQIKSTAVGARAFADLSEDAIANMDMDDIQQKQVEQLEKEKREKDEKLKSQEKKVDYFERAKCLEMIPLLAAKFQKEEVETRKYWEDAEKERIDELIADREMGLLQRDRLLRMDEDRKQFISRLKDHRLALHKEKLKEFDMMLFEERKKRLLERREQRKENRRNKWIQDKEEAEQRKKEEEEIKQKEELERIAAEKREQEKAEDDERKRKFNEQTEKQRLRDLEIEEKQRKKKEEFQMNDLRRGEETNRPANKWMPPKEGGWRAREKAKEESWRKDTKEETTKEDTVAAKWGPSRGGRSPPRDNDEDDDDHIRRMRREDGWKSEGRRDASPSDRPSVDSWRDRRGNDDRKPSRDFKSPRDDFRRDTKDDRGGWGDRGRYERGQYEDRSGVNSSRDDRGYDRQDDRNLRDDRRDDRFPRDDPDRRDDRGMRDNRGGLRNDRGGGGSRDDRGVRDNRGGGRDDREGMRDERGGMRDNRRDDRFFDRGFDRKDDDRWGGREDRGGTPREDRGPRSDGYHKGQRDDRGPRDGGRGGKDGGGDMKEDRDEYPTLSRDEHSLPDEPKNSREDEFKNSKPIKKEEDGWETVRR